MLNMIIEHFSRKAGPERFTVDSRKKGRMMPTELHYIDSWVSADLRICYQLSSTVSR